MTIDFERVDSRSELVESLRRMERSMLLGNDDEATREYFRAAMPSCAIGVCSQGHGPKPGGLIDELNAEGWIGYNSRVANFDLRECRIRFVVRLDGVFFSILNQLADGSVIVVYELGVCRISRSGELLWNCTTDVVTDFSDDGTFVRLQTDEAELRVDKERGVALR
jgi:hypothetical protein